MNLLVQSITGSNLKSNDITHTSKELLNFSFQTLAALMKGFSFLKRGHLLHCHLNI